MTVLIVKRLQIQMQQNEIYISKVRVRNDSSFFVHKFYTRFNEEDMTIAVIGIRVLTRVRLNTSVRGNPFNVGADIDV